MSKRSLFVGDTSENISKFNVDPKFAQRYKHNKDREALQRAKELGLDDRSYSETSESEDEEAELINPIVSEKFNNLLKMIRDNDSRIKDPNFNPFDDADFEIENEKQSKEKPVYYKHLITSEVPEDAPVKQEKAAKDDFLAAMDDWEAGQITTDDFLKVRKKAKKMPAAAENRSGNFLEDFLASKAWVEPEEMLMTYNEVIDQEDEQREDEMDNFEAAYNFRYEEEGSNSIATHSRNAKNSLRQNDSARKLNRAKQAEDRQYENVRKQQEIKQLKNIVKSEVQQKLDRINNQAGTDLYITQTDITGDFNPDEHDQKMDQLFSEKYYEMSDSDNIEQGDVANDEVTNEMDLKRIEQTTETPEFKNDWWMCDECFNGIPPGHYRFDCQICENFTICEECKYTTQHGHKLTRRRVPAHCVIPDNLVQIFCDGCEANITYAVRRDCPRCPDFSLCERCDVPHPHELVSTTESILNELDNAEQIGPAFPYKQVKAMTYGLTDDDLLNLEDSELKQYVSIKKLAPYREDEGFVKSKTLKNKKKILGKKKKKEKPEKEASGRLNSYGLK